MLAEDEGPDSTAIAWTNSFLDAGVAKLDALFGEGYARANPAALAAYLGACSSQVSAFLTAATTAAALAEDFDDGFEDADFAEESLLDALSTFAKASTPPPGRSKGKRR